MNKKAYWKKRKWLKTIEFKIKKLLFSYNENKNDIIISLSLRSQLTLLMIKNSIISVVFAIILLLIEQKLHLKIEIEKQYFMDFLYADIGIIGVILGLYCSNIYSIYSAQYINAPKTLSNAFKNDIVSNRCVKEIISYLVFCIFVILENLIGYDSNIITIVIVVLFTIYIIVSFSSVGNRSQQLANTFNISEMIYKDIYKIIKKISTNNLFSSDINFQNHYQKICTSKINVLKEIAIYNKNIPVSQNHALVSFMDKNIVIIMSYLKEKKTIYYDSYWFKEIIIYKQLHTASYSDLQTVYNTGVFLGHKTEKHINWFEEAILKVNDICLEKLCNDKDIENIHSYLIFLNNAIDNYELDSKSIIEILDYINNISNKILSVCIEESNIKDKANYTYIYGISDLFSCIYIALILRCTSAIDSIDINNLISLAKDITNYKDASKKHNFYYNNRKAEQLYKCIEMEIKAEGIRITSDWYIEQTICEIIYNEICSISESLNTIIFKYISLIEFFNSNKISYSTVLVLSRLTEISNKVNRFSSIAEDKLKYLNSKHFEKAYLWKEYDINQISNTIKACVNKYPQYIYDNIFNIALENWKNREEKPDLFGLSYNYICDYLIKSIIDDDIEQFKSFYNKFLEFVLLYQEYIRTDVIKIKENHYQDYVLTTIILPLIDYSVISGLAIIWGEVTRISSWKNIVNNKLDEFINSGNSNDLQIVIDKWLTEADYYKDTKFKMNSRSILHTNWEMNIAKNIQSKNLITFEQDGFYGNSIKTGNPLLDSFCKIRLHDCLSLDNVEEVFYIVSLNNYCSKDKKYISRFNWEKGMEL